MSPMSMNRLEEKVKEESQKTLKGKKQRKVKQRTIKEERQRKVKELKNKTSKNNICFKSFFNLNIIIINKLK